MRQFKITVNGKAYDVQVEENGAPVASAPTAPAAPAPVAAPAAAPAPAASAAPAAAGEGTPVEAPMPGTILKVLVSNGQAVMKMENEITAPCDGTVTSVCVNTGDSVDAGKVLLTIK